MDPARTDIDTRATLREEPTGFWGGIYAAGGMIFCQMQVERCLLREIDRSWELITEIQQPDDEPFLVFQARADTLIDSFALERSLVPIRLLSKECYRRLGLGDVMRKMMG